MKIVTVVGARPQFIKAAPVSRALRAAGLTEFILHTGQHYDDNMSDVFFRELNLPTPDINLNIGSGLHGQQTGRMLEGIEKILLRERPAGVIVYGDTNSTLAGAIAAVKLHTPVAHIEAGLRSYNRSMPEEHNRILTDHCADILFCPTKTAVSNLSKEGITNRVYKVGDVMLDAVQQYASKSGGLSPALVELGIRPKEYFLATIHRPSNSDNIPTLQSIISALSELNLPVIFPIHPRTEAKIRPFLEDLIDPSGNKIHFIAPQGYLSMLSLERNARAILTDSGGIQKEAYFFEVPCLTIRTETEWIETLEGGWNRLVQPDKTGIVNAVSEAMRLKFLPPSPVFGDGTAGLQIASIIGSAWR